MTNKKNANFNMPAELLARYEEAIEGRLHKKQKWIGISAAIVLFLELPEEARSVYMQRVAGADLGDGFHDLIERARRGELRIEAARAVSGENPWVGETPPSNSQGGTENSRLPTPSPAEARGRRTEAEPGDPGPRQDEKLQGGRKHRK